MTEATTSLKTDAAFDSASPPDTTGPLEATATPATSICSNNKMGLQQHGAEDTLDFSVVPSAGVENDALLSLLLLPTAAAAAASTPLSTATTTKAAEMSMTSATDSVCTHENQQTIGTEATVFSNKEMILSSPPPLPSAEICATAQAEDPNDSSRCTTLMTSTTKTAPTQEALDDNIRLTSSSENNIGESVDAVTRCTISMTSTTTTTTTTAPSPAQEALDNNIRQTSSSENNIVSSESVDAVTRCTAPPTTVPAPTTTTVPSPAQEALDNNIRQTSSSENNIVSSESVNAVTRSFSSDTPANLVNGLLEQVTATTPTSAGEKNMEAFKSEAVSRSTTSPSRKATKKRKSTEITNSKPSVPPSSSNATTPACPQSTVAESQQSLPGTEEDLPVSSSSLSLPKITPYDPKQNMMHCTIHRPSLEELQSQSFSNYIRRVVLPAASVSYQIDEEDDDDDSSNASSPDAEENDEKFNDYSTPASPTTDSRNNRNQHKKTKSSSKRSLGKNKKNNQRIQLREGIAKVVLPRGFQQKDPLVTDETGRGPTWQEGTVLGDWEITSPIQQHVRGVAGIYEYTFTDQPATTIAAFREKADAYRIRQVGRAEEETPIPYTPERLAALERMFWKRLGPTMPPPLYGADQSGSLFNPEDKASGWSLAHLDSCLQVMIDRIPGVTTPYLYAGMWPAYWN